MSNFEDKVWSIVSEESILNSPFKEHLLVAKSEITRLESAGIFEKGQTWTNLWYRLELHRSEIDNGWIEVPDESVSLFVEEAQNDPHAFELFRLVSASYLERHNPLPDGMSKVIVGWLKGEVVEPRAKKRQPDQRVWVRDYMIHYVADILEGRYRLLRTRNAATLGFAASDIIVHAIPAGYGANLDIGTVQNILTDSQKRQVYDDMKALRFTNMLDDLP